MANRLDRSPRKLGELTSKAFLRLVVKDNILAAISVPVTSVVTFLLTSIKNAFNTTVLFTLLDLVYFAI